MIISPDKTKAFLAITKTGSTTVETLLAQIPGVIVLDNMRVKHGTRLDLAAETHRDSRLDGVDPWEITCYGFVRNPLDRWFSACNYLKQFPYALTRLFPEKFPEGTLPIPIPTDDYKRRLSSSDWNSLLNQEQRNLIRGLTPEDFLAIPFDRLGSVMNPLIHWFTHGVEGLRFDDFENETRRIISLFGGDPLVDIPKTNASDDFPASVKYQKTPELYLHIFNRYTADYMICDNYGIAH